MARAFRSWAQDCDYRLILSAVILVAALLLLSLGVAVATGGAAAYLDLLQPAELIRTAKLLRVPEEQTKTELNWVYIVVFLVGYATVNVGVVAVCAASGRRRVHSAAGATAAAGVGVVYLGVLVSTLRPRVSRVRDSLDKALRVYFEAFRITGDERFIGQLQLYTSCCGYTGGPVQFQTWHRPIPSSCCGQLLGGADACRGREVRPVSCRQAVRQLVGSDGLFDLSHFVWLLGSLCILLCVLLGLQLISSSGDSIERLLSLRRRAEARLRRWRRQAIQADGADEALLDGKPRRKRRRKRPEELDVSQMSSRDRELHRLMLESDLETRRALAARQRRQELAKMQQKLESQIRKRAIDMVPDLSLRAKAIREREIQRAREREAEALVSDGQFPAGELGSGGGGSGGSSGGMSSMLEAKMKQEAEREKLLLRQMLAAEEKRK